MKKVLHSVDRLELRLAFALAGVALGALRFFYRLARGR